MRIPFERRRGDTYADEFTIRTKRTKTPINLTGYTFLMTVDSREFPSDISTQQFQMTGTIINAVQGRVEFAPTEEQANRVGNFFYDVQIVDGLGRKRTIAAGPYDMIQDITK